MSDLAVFPVEVLEVSDVTRAVPVDAAPVSDADDVAPDNNVPNWAGFMLSWADPVCADCPADWITVPCGCIWKS